MPNKTRPRHCGAAMAPLYGKTKCGAWRKLPRTFHCRDCLAMATGRRNSRTLERHP